MDESSRRTVGPPVVLFDVLPEGQDQLIDGQPGRSDSPAAAGAPLGQDALVFRFAFVSVVGAEQYVFATAAGQAQRHDRLTGLLVMAVGGDRIRTAGHGGNPFLRKNSAVFGFLCRTADRRQVS